MADYFTASGDPVTSSAGESATIRQVFTDIATGFTKVAAYTGNANKAVVINAGATGQTVTTGTLALAGNFATTGAYNLTLALSASVTITLPATSATMARTDAAQTFTGVQTFSSQPILSSLTASQAVFTDGSKGLVSNAITGSGNVVMSTNAVMVTPNLGTPSALVGTNITGTAAGLTAGTVTTNANLTGDVTSVGNATTLATVNANVGSFGSATQVGTFTVNAKGLITAASNTTVTPAVGSITGLGTGVATALAVNVGSAGAFVTFNGALGTPSSGTGTNITGIPAASILAGSFGAGAFVVSTSLQAATIELGHATDTTLSRVSAGVIAVEGVNILASGATGVQTFLTTPSSANLAAAVTDETGSGALVFGTSPAFTTNISTPSIITASGALGITPAAGSGVNITLSTTGDFAVNTSQLYVDTSAAMVGIGMTNPARTLDVTGTFGTTGAITGGSTITSTGTITANAAASTYVSVAFNNTNGGADAKKADWLNNGNNVQLRFINDAGSSANDVINAQRSGYTVSNLTLGGSGTAVAVPGTLAVTGSITATAGQIVFPATQNASADANTLDDYEEGTWTPVIAFGGASVGVTYSTQQGRYTKIGRLVHVTCSIVLTANGSSTGATTITGLPFTVGVTSAGSVHHQSTTAGVYIQMLLLGSGTAITLRTIANASVLDTDVGDTAEFYISATYTV